MITDGENWRPKFADCCAFWDDISKVSRYGVFNNMSGGLFISDGGWLWNHCAALESLDEIGKPVSYFIERGRWA
jgi:hypothetical protein